MKVAKFKKLCEILDRHNREPGKLIPILQETQEAYSYLPEDMLAFIATSLGLPPARVYGVATFYAHFTLAPKGKHVIRLCNGTACNVRGSMSVYDALLAKLGLTEEKHTTDDMLFTLEMVSCLGACGLAPVVMVNDDIYGQVTPEKAVELVDAILEQEK